MIFIKKRQKTEKEKNLSKRVDLLERRAHNSTSPLGNLREKA
jgi:hypothetical protein